MKKIVFISAVSGVGKSTTCNYIKDNNLLVDCDIYDIDDLVNINNYDKNTYNLFYEDAINKAIIKSERQNIIIASCINPNDIENITIPNNVESLEMFLVYCSNEELEKRLKSRDENRNCSSDEFIKEQIEYQKYLLEQSNKFQLSIDNTNITVEEVANQITNHLNKNNRKQ